MEHVIRSCLLALRLGERGGWTRPSGRRLSTSPYFVDRSAPTRTSWRAGSATTSRSGRQLRGRPEGAGTAFAWCSPLRPPRPCPCCSFLPRIRDFDPMRTPARWPVRSVSGSASARTSVRRSSRCSSAGMARATRRGCTARSSRFRCGSCIWRRSSKSSTGRRFEPRSRSPVIGPEPNSTLASSTSSALPPDPARGLDADTTWDQVIAAEPALRRSLSAENQRVPRLATFYGINRRTGSGIRAGSRSSRRQLRKRSGLPDPEVESLRRAGLVHDLGPARRVERDLGQTRCAYPA